MDSDEDVFRGPPWVLDVRWRHSFGALAAALEGARRANPLTRARRPLPKLTVANYLDERRNCLAVCGSPSQLWLLQP